MLVSMCIAEVLYHDTVMSQIPHAQVRLLNKHSLVATCVLHHGPILFHEFKLDVHETAATFSLQHEWCYSDSADIQHPHVWCLVETIRAFAQR